jgi:hypothetical protein
MRFLIDSWKTNSSDASKSRIISSGCPSKYFLKLISFDYSKNTTNGIVSKEISRNLVASGKDRTITLDKSEI